MVYVCICVYVFRHVVQIVDVLYSWLVSPTSSQEYQWRPNQRYITLKLISTPHYRFYTLPTLSLLHGLFYFLKVTGLLTMSTRPHLVD